MTEVESKVRLRVGTAANATANNKVLAVGEVGIETDTHRAKLGDGVTAWNSLPYTWVTNLEFDEKVDDRVNALVLVAGLLSKTYDDGANTLTLDVTAEAIQDMLSTFIVGAGLTTVNYDDGANTLTVGVTTEDIQDMIGTFLTDSGLVVITYDDAGNALDIGISTEAVQDVIGAIISGSGPVNAVYDDGANTFVISIDAATATDAGIVELATSTEVQTGTDTARAITPDALHDSDYGVRTIRCEVSNGGSVLTTGAIEARATIPWTCTIEAWTLLADQAGDVVVDVWVDTYANYPPTNADSITASDKPTITASTKATGSALTGWDVTLTAGSVVRFEIESVTSITALAIELQVRISA